MTEATAEVQPEQPGTELEVQDGGRALAGAGLFDPDLDFRKLLLETKYREQGFRLIPKDFLGGLKADGEAYGVPHIIVGVTYREGYLKNKVKADYVSVEAVIADKDILQDPAVRAFLPDPMMVYPNEAIVYNDGGTGIRRRLTEIFAALRMIDVGPEEEGYKSKFDKQYQKWEYGAEAAQDGFYVDSDGEKFRYFTRGLRLSTYDNEYGPGKTYYLS